MLYEYHTCPRCKKEVEDVSAGYPPGTVFMHARCAGIARLTEKLTSLNNQMVDLTKEIEATTKALERLKAASPNDLEVSINPSCG